MTKKKTEREEVFAREYIKDLNGTRAAIAAGYAKKSAHVASSRLLKKDKVKDLIARLKGRQFEALDFSANKVLAELCKMAFSNISDYIRVDDGEAYVDLSTMTREQAAAVQEITSEVYTDGYVGTGEDRKPIQVKRTKFKLADKRGSLELLGKHLKLFVDRTEVSGPGGTPIQVISHVPRPQRGRAA
jgi:phage terminase small subunit